MVGRRRGSSPSSGHCSTGAWGQPAPSWPSCAAGHACTSAGATGSPRRAVRWYTPVGYRVRRVPGPAPRVRYSLEECSGTGDE